jgi:hypothetical protein
VFSSPKRAKEKNNEKIIHYQFCSGRHRAFGRVQRRRHQQPGSEQACDPVAVTGCDRKPGGKSVGEPGSFTGGVTGETGRLAGNKAGSQGNS